MELPPTAVEVTTMAGERIRAQLRDLDQAAGRLADEAVGSVRERVREARERRAINTQDDASLRERAKAELRGRRDSEPGEESPSARQRLARAVSGAGEAAAGGQEGGREPETMERARRLAQMEGPTDHSLEPVDGRGMGSFADFVAGTRPAEGLQRFQQTADRADLMQWQGQHRDGSATVVTARTNGGEWAITASEENPAGRVNGSTVIARVDTRQEARERALDWIEEHPDGIPFDQQAGQRGTAGEATRLPAADQLVYGGGGGADAGDDGMAGGLGGGDELVTQNDLNFISGGDR